MGKRSLVSLDWLNFFMADVETGIGPFVATYLSAAHHWNPAQVGWVLAAQNFAELVAQTPSGWLIDHVRAKRWLVAAAAFVISVGCFLIVAAPTVPLQAANQIAIGIAAAVVSPTVAAISLGIVGRQALARRVGRNAAFSHGGNVTTALLAGYLGYAAGQQWIFYSCGCLGMAAIASALLIPSGAIDDDAARGLPSLHDGSASPRSLLAVLKETRILPFACLLIVFHIANAALLPLAGQELAAMKKSASASYMSVAIITAQLVMVVVAYLVGRLANHIGRKPLFLVAFAVVALRAMLFAAHQQALYIVAVEVLDGIGTATASVLTVLVVSDLANGTGRFNFMQGLAQAAVSIGAFLGNSGAGMVAHSAGFSSAFLALAATAVFGGVLYSVSMPGTVAAVNP